MAAFELSNISLLNKYAGQAEARVKETHPENLMMVRLLDAFTALM